MRYFRSNEGVPAANLVAAIMTAIALIKGEKAAEKTESAGEGNEPAESDLG